MHTIARIVLSIAVAILLAACAGRQAHERMAARLDAYETVAGAPVDSFRYFSFWSWEALGEDKLAVYTRPNEAYLIDVFEPCEDLRFASAIAITSSINRVYARFDTIRPLRGGVSNIAIDCRIEQIRPVDVRELKAVVREQRAVEAIEREAQE